MPVMKKGSDGKWTTIDNYCFYDKTLSYKEIGLLCSMLSLPDDWKFNVRGLASLHADGVDSVSSGLNSLIEKGYVYREQENSSKGFQEIIYWVYQTPEDNPHFVKKEKADCQEESPDTVSPCTEKPYTGDQDTEKPCTGDRTLLNTNNSIPNELNTKESNTKESDSYISNENTLTMEEIESWDYEEFYDHLDDEQYDAFMELFNLSKRGEIRTCKESLMGYFKKMMANGWKDSRGKPIKNIVGYVTTNFSLHSQTIKEDIC